MRILKAMLALGLAGIAVLSNSGCRDCSSRDGGASESTSASASGPVMPTGLLTPLPDAPVANTPASSPLLRLAIARGQKSGEWSELQAAAPNDAPDRSNFDHWRSDSWFLSLDAMTLLHDPFARAMPGFDLFLPRLFDGAALGHLRSELDTMKTELAAISNVRAAKGRWGAFSPLVRDLPDDAAWLGARAALVATITELIALTTDLEKNGRGLWVLGI